MAVRRPVSIILLAIVLPLLVFVKMMGGHADLPQADRFRLLSVPAQSVPFGDLRNIQAAVACAELSRPIYGDSECVRAATGARATYPQVEVPRLNYPPIWLRIYGSLDDHSERYFLLFGWLNAVALIMTLLVMCLRWSPLMFPVFLFSPPVMLCIERGNIDGMTFAVTMLPLLLCRPAFARGLGLGVAAGLKVFPVFALLMAGGLSSKLSRRFFWLGGLVGLALLLESWLTLPLYIGQASGGFDVAYGLGTWRYAKWLEGRPVWVALLQGGFILAAILVLWRGWRSGAVRQLGGELAMLLEADRLALGASLAIFLATFFLSASWAYRIIYLMPTLLLFSQFQHQLFKWLLAIGLLLFWVPVLGVGWRYFNVVASVAALLSLPVVWALLRGAVSEAPAAVVSDAGNG